MICKNCGNVIPDESIFCTECGASVDSQPTFEPEYTDFADPVACAEEAQACIKKAKVALPMGIVAIAAYPAGTAVGIIGGFFGYFTLGIVSLISSPIATLLCLASIVCMIIGLIFASKTSKIDVQPDTVDPELYESYLSAKKKAKITKILCIITLSMIVAVTLVSILIGIGALVVLGGIAGIMVFMEGGF